MRLLFILICAISCFNRYGEHFWTGKRISKRKFRFTIQRKFENDILAVVENYCDCTFDDKMYNLEKGDELIFELEVDLINIYLNGVFITSQENTNKCFFCIQDNFK